MSSFLKTSTNFNEYWESSGLKLCLDFGRVIARLDNIFSNKPDDVEKKAVEAVREWQNKVRFFFEATHQNASLKPFISKRNSETRSVDLRICSLISYLMYRVMVDGDDYTYITTACNVGARSDVDHGSPLEWRRLIAGLLCTENILKVEKTGDKIGLSESFLKAVLKESAILTPAAISEIKTALKAAEEKDAKKKAGKNTPEAVPVIPGTVNILTPQQIYNELVAKVVGQDDACRAVATRGALHLRRAALMAQGTNVGRNECLLFVGASSGCGKTMVAHEASKVFRQPFTVFDSTLATGSGFYGSDICSDSLRSLLYSVGDPKKKETFAQARNATLFYDEFTKKSVKEANNSSGRDISGHQVQVEVLRIMEGGTVPINSKRSESEFACPEISTSGMLLIFAGLIDHFDKALKRLQDRGTSIGFGSELQHKRGTYLYDLLTDYGMIPEFLNRLSGIIPFRQLDIQDFVRIATFPHGAISHFNTMLEPQGLKVSFTDRAIREMAQFCMDTAQARGLHLLIGNVCEEAIFNGASGAIEYDIDSVREAEDRMQAG